MILPECNVMKKKQKKNWADINHHHTTPVLIFFSPFLISHTRIRYSWWWSRRRLKIEPNTHIYRNKIKTYLNLLSVWVSRINVNVILFTIIIIFIIIRALVCVWCVYAFESLNPYTHTSHTNTYQKKYNDGNNNLSFKT